jgi:hypothetical protein
MAIRDRPLTISDAAARRVEALSKLAVNLQPAEADQSAAKQ